MAKDVQIPAFIQELRARLGIPGSLNLRLDETISPVIVLDVPGARLSVDTRVRPCWGFASVAAVVGLNGRTNLNVPNGASIVAHITRCVLSSQVDGAFDLFMGGNVLTAGGDTLFRDDRTPNFPTITVGADTDIGAVIQQMLVVRMTATERTKEIPLDIWMVENPALGHVVPPRPMWIFSVVNSQIDVTWYWDEFDLQVSVTP